jgi:hypothetical protein
VTPRFWIGWIESEQAGPGLPSRRGRIVAPELDETFTAPLDVWSADEYTAQWREGLRRVVVGEGASALVTRLLRSRRGLLGGERWTMYRSRDVVVLRNQLVMPETIPGSDLSDPYSSILPRDPKRDLSEWTIPIGLIDEFLAEEAGVVMPTSEDTRGWSKAKRMILWEAAGEIGIWEVIWEIGDRAPYDAWFEEAGRMALELCAEGWFVPIRRLAHDTATTTILSASEFEEAVRDRDSFTPPPFGEPALWLEATPKWWYWKRTTN